jgi:predicted nucleic acid-binding protein
MEIKKYSDYMEKIIIADSSPLAVEKNLKLKTESCIILDDHHAKNILNKKNLGIHYIGLLRILNFAYSQGYFKKEHIRELVKKINSHNFYIPKNAADIIYGKKYDAPRKGIKR